MCCRRYEIYVKNTKSQSRGGVIPTETCQSFTLWLRDEVNISSY